MVYVVYYQIYQVNPSMTLDFYSYSKLTKLILSSQIYDFSYLKISLTLNGQLRYIMLKVLDLIEIQI